MKTEIDELKALLSIRENQKELLFRSLETIEIISGGPKSKENIIMARAALKEINAKAMAAMTQVASLNPKKPM